MKPDGQTVTRDFLPILSSVIDHIEEDNKRANSFYKGVNKINLAKYQKIEYIQQQLMKLYRLIQSLQILSFTQIIQEYLKVSSSFSIDYRKKMQIILKQLLEIELSSKGSDCQIKTVELTDIAADQQDDLKGLLRSLLTKAERSHEFLSNDLITWSAKDLIKNRQNQSGYRGVSSNGTCGWQTMCHVDGRHQFIMTVENKQMAAIINDIVLIQNNGIKIKTNFNYNYYDVFGIMILGSILEFRNNSTCNTKWPIVKKSYLSKLIKSS